MDVIVLLLAAAFLCTTSQAVDPPIPQLPRYFTTFAEYYTLKNDSSSTLLFLQGFYDEDFQIKRDDFAAEAFVPNAVGTLSLIDDAGLGIRYSIFRHFSNCTVSVLDSTTTEDVFVNSSNGLRLKSLQEIFFLTDDFNYTYKGVETLRGIEVDTWNSSVFNFSSNSGVNYTNTRTEVSFTRPNVSYPSLTSYSSEPVFFRFSLQGIVSVLKDGVIQSTNVSTFENFIGGSYEEPSFDAFDVSLCSDPSEYQIATLFIPGHVNGVDLSVLRKSIRSQFSNYTGLYPIQIGSIEILGENGTYIFVKLHLSNLTSIAIVNNSVTADEAIQLLLDNSVDGRLPFPIELTPGNSLTPMFRFQNENQRCRNQVNKTTVMITPTGTVTPPPSTVYCSSMCPSSGVITVTVTHTVTTCPSGPTCPGNTSPQGLSTGPAVGLAFGMFIAGIVFTIVAMCLFVICRNRIQNKSWKNHKGYERQRDEVAYFK